MNPFKSLSQFFARLFLTTKPPMSDTSDLPILRGDGTWPWHAYIDGNDIIVLGARATCFGGANDPQDSGETASGLSTKLNPRIVGCALPMNYSGRNPGLRKALAGSPIPKMPYKGSVVVTSGGKSLTMPCIDLGPAKRTGNAIDLTIQAARHFKAGASATNFAMTCDFRILGAAKHARKGSIV
jgi:hypothetical protein